MGGFINRKIKKMKTLKELEKNKHLISELKLNEKGNHVRIVDGKEIIQIKEDSPEAIEKNRLINLWRMRYK